MIIDANIVIGYLAGDELIIEKLSEWRRNGIPFFLPSVVEAEVLSFSKWTEEERRHTEEFLTENFNSFPLDRPLARLTGIIRAIHKLKFPDAAIAASALQSGMPLATRNIKDFKKIPKLTIIKL